MARRAALCLVLGSPLLASVGCGSDFVSASDILAGETGETDARAEPDTDSADTETDSADTETDDELCEAPASYLGCEQTHDPTAAIGLGCGFAGAGVEALAASLSSTDPDAWRTAAAFGSASDAQRVGGRLWAPQKPAPGHNLDDRLLLLSTGRLPPANLDGQVIAAPASQGSQGDNLNPDAGPLPAPLSFQPGSAGGAGGDPFHDCDGVHDCGESLFEPFAAGGLPHDAIHLGAALQVPAGTHGLRLELAFFSAEFPEFIASPFADMLVVWSTSEAYTGNVALIEGRALTATALAQKGWMAHAGDDPALAGTGFEGHGGSGWLSLHAPVVPGETVALTIYLADMGDGSMATVAAIDDLRWDCDACDFVGGERPCGLAPQI